MYVWMDIHNILLLIIIIVIACVDMSEWVCGEWHGCVINDLMVLTQSVAT